jgi:hypothetical protein
MSNVIGVARTIASIALDIPPHPTTRDLITALVRAEELGYDRANGENTCPVCAPRNPNCQHKHRVHGPNIHDAVQCEDCGVILKEASYLRRQAE